MLKRAVHSIAIAALMLIAPEVGANEDTIASASDTSKEWHQWRGPEFNGVARNSNPPVEWSEDKNIRWKVEVPGQGLSSPIVIGDRVYIQTAIATDKGPDGKAVEPKKDDEPDEGEGRRRRGRRREAPSTVHKFAVLAYDRATGKKVWEHVVREEVPHEGNHPDASQASASPVTDGKHLYAHFGSRGLYCLDLNGKPVWDADLGDMQTRNGFGEGSSPALHGDTLVVPWDHEGDSFIVALDKNTGKPKWRRQRDEATQWATPLIIPYDEKRMQVVVPASNALRAYDLESGATIWQCAGLGSNCVPCPVATSGIVLAMSGHRSPALLAIRYEGATGDITDSDRIAWKLDGRTPYVPSPLLYDSLLYFLEKNTPKLSCHDAVTGKEHYAKQRLEGMNGVYASPVGAAGHVYIAGRAGTTAVLKHGPEFEVVAMNELDDGFAASPAIAGNEIYLRGAKYLYCIAGQ